MDQETSAPTQAQQEWMGSGYGLFIHFGPNTFAGTSWEMVAFQPRGLRQHSLIQLNGPALLWMQGCDMLYSPPSITMVFAYGQAS